MLMNGRWRGSLVDNLCKQVIERHLLRPLPSHVWSETLAGYSDADLTRIAAEYPQTLARQNNSQVCT